MYGYVELLHPVRMLVDTGLCTKEKKKTKEKFYIQVTRRFALSPVLGYCFLCCVRNGLGRCHLIHPTLGGGWKLTFCCDFVVFTIESFPTDLDKMIRIYLEFLKFILVVQELLRIQG